MRLPIEISTASTIEWTAQPSGSTQPIVYPSDTASGTVALYGEDSGSPQSDSVTVRSYGPAYSGDTFDELIQAVFSTTHGGETRILGGNGQAATGDLTFISQPAHDVTLTLGPSLLTRVYTFKRGEKSTVTTVADVANSLDGLYFDIYDGANAVRVWINTSGGGASAPATPSGGRLLEVAITTGDSANTVASLIAAAFNADSMFYAEVSTNVVTVWLNALGNVTNIAAGTSTFTVATVTAGTDAANQVLIGKTIYQTARNLANAINDDTGEGSRYGTGTTVHLDLEAGATAGSTTALNGTSDYVVFVRDKYPVLRVFGWECYLSSGSSLTIRPPSGGVDGTVLATIPPGSTQVGEAVSLDNEDLADTNFPATLTPTFDVVRLGGGPARVTVFRHASDANVAFLLKAGISPDLCTTTLETITANGATPVVSALIQGYEYLLISVSSNSNSSPARVAGFVTYQP